VWGVFAQQQQQHVGHPLTHTCKPKTQGTTTAHPTTPTNSQTGAAAHLCPRPARRVPQHHVREHPLPRPLLRVPHRPVAEQAVRAARHVRAELPQRRVPGRGREEPGQQLPLARHQAARGGGGVRDLRVPADHQRVDGGDDGVEGAARLGVDVGVGAAVEEDDHVPARGGW